MSDSLDPQKFFGSFIELIVPRRIRPSGQSHVYSEDDTPVRSVSQYCERLFGSQPDAQYTFLERTDMRAETTTLVSNDTSLYPVERMCRSCRKIEFFMSIIESGSRTLVVGDLRCRKCGKRRRIGGPRFRGYSQVHRSFKARQSELWIPSSVILLAKEHEHEAADSYEGSVVVSEHVDSNLLQDLYNESARRLNLGASEDDSVSSEPSQSTIVTVGAESWPQPDVSPHSAVNFLEGSCSQFESLSERSATKTEEIEEERLLLSKVPVEDIPTFTEIEEKRSRQSSVDGNEEVERRSSTEGVSNVGNNKYEFVVDTESEDEREIETMYEDDVASKRTADQETFRTDLKKSLQFSSPDEEEENLYLQEGKISPPATTAFCPKPNVCYEYLQDTAVEGRISKMLEYKDFLSSRYPKLSFSAYCDKTSMPVHRYDVDVRYEDPFDYKLAELKQTRNKPINFIIIAKPGIDTYKLAAELALLWGNVLITPLTVLREPWAYKSYVNYEITETLRLGNSAPMHEVFALIEEQILHDEGVRHLGYTLAGLPFIPRLADKLSVHEQLLRIFNWPNRPDALVYIMCPTPDVLCMANNMRFNMRTGSVVHEGMVRHGEKLSKEQQPVEAAAQNELTACLIDLYRQEEVGPDSNSQFKIRLPLSDVEQLSKDIKEFSEAVLSILDCYVLQMDPQMVIRVDARTPVNRMIQIIKKKLNTLLVQKPYRVVPLFDESFVREYEKKRQAEEEAKKKAASKSHSKRREKISADDEEEETVGEEEETGYEEKQEEEEEDADEEAETTDKSSKQVNFDKLNALTDDKLLLTLQRTNTLSPEIRWTETNWGCICPVSVYDGLLRRGRAEYAATYLGKLYVLSSRDAFERFTRSPKKFGFPSLPFTNRIFLYGNERVVNTIKEKFGMQVIDFLAVKSLAARLKRLSDLSKYLQEWRKYKMFQFNLVEQNKFNITEEVRAQMIADWRDEMVALIMDYLVYKDWLPPQRSYVSSSSSSHESESIDWAVKLNLPDIYYEEYATKDTLSSYTLQEISLPYLAIDGDDASLDSIQQQVVDFVTRYTEEQRGADRAADDEGDEVETLCREVVSDRVLLTETIDDRSGKSVTSITVRSGDRLPPIHGIKFKPSGSEVVSIAQGSVILTDRSKSSRPSSEDKLPPLATASGKTFENLKVSASAQDTTRLPIIPKKESSEPIIEGKQRGSKSSIRLSSSARSSGNKDVAATSGPSPSTSKTGSSERFIEGSQRGSKSSVRLSPSARSSVHKDDTSEQSLGGKSCSSTLSEELKLYNLVRVQPHCLETILKKILTYIVKNTVPRRKSSIKQITDDRQLVNNICNEFFANMMAIINGHRLADRLQRKGSAESESSTLQSREVPPKRDRKDAIDVHPSFFDDLLLHLMKTTKRAVKRHPLFRKTLLIAEGEPMESRARVFGNTSDDDVEVVKTRVKHATLNPQFLTYFLNLFKAKTMKTTSSRSVKNKSIDGEIQFLREMEILKLATSQIFYGDDLMLLKDCLAEKAAKISSSEEYVLNRFKHRIIRLLPRAYSTIADEITKFGPLEERLQRCGLPIWDDVDTCLAIVEDPEKVLKYLPDVYSHFWFSPDTIREDHPIIEKALKEEANRYLNMHKESETVTDLEAVELLIAVMEDIKNANTKDSHWKCIISRLFSELQETTSQRKRRKGCVVINMPQSEEIWKCLCGNRLLPTDVLYVQGVTQDDIKEDTAETRSGKLVVDPDNLMTSEEDLDEARLVESVNMDEEADVLRKSFSDLPATKTFPSPMELIRTEDVSAATDFKIRFGFEETELDDFINKVCSAEDIKSTAKEGSDRSSTKIMKRTLLEVETVAAADSEETPVKRRLDLAALVQLSNMKGEYEDVVENQETAETDGQPIPIEDLEVEIEEKVADLEGAAVLPDSWIDFRTGILDKYRLNVTSVNYEADKPTLFEQKIASLIDDKFKPKARRFMKDDKEILQVADIDKKKEVNGDEDEAEESELEEEKVEEEELEDEETEEDVEAAEEVEDEEGEYKQKKIQPEVNERLEVNRNYGDTFPFCPVLFKKGVYTEGVKKFSTVYLNQIHLLSSQEALDEFVHNPEVYAHFSTPPEIPPPRICVVGTVGCNGSSICKSLAQLLGIYYISLYGQINFHVMPNDFLPVGLMYESPRCVKEVPLNVKPVDATEVEINSVNRIRRYLNYCGPLPDCLLERYMIRPFWKRQSYASQGFCYYRFPHTSRDMRRMVQMRCLPDVIVHVESNLKNVKNLVKRVTKNWKISQGVVKKMLIERDKIEKRTFWKNRKAMFRKLLLDFLDSESQRISAQTSQTIIKEEIGDQPETMHAEDTGSLSEERTTDLRKKSELLVLPTEGETKNIIKDVIDDILRQPSWMFSHRFYDYLEKTGLRPPPGFDPKRHNKAQRRIILRNILQIHEIQTKLFPKINRIIREHQSRLKLVANKIRHFDKVPDPYDYLMAAFRKESQQITLIKKLAKENKIPWITHKPKDKVDKLYSYVSDVIRERLTYLLKTDLLTTETAEKLLESGHLALSKFGRWCPVQLTEGKNPMQMYFLAERSSAQEIFPVVFRKYVYFLSSKEAKTKFCLNPLKYVQRDAYARVVPLRCAVIGPPKAGKTEFANRLAREFGVEVVSIGRALRYVTEEMPWTDLAKAVLWHLKSGRLVPDALSIRALEAALLFPKSATQGWVLDGCPDNVKQLVKLYELNIVPMKIILLDRAYSECLYNSRTVHYPHTSLKKKPVYSSKLLEEKYRIWMSGGDRLRLVKSINELWGNLHVHSSNKTAYFVYQTAVPYLLRTLTVQRKYVESIMKETAAELKEMCVTSLEFIEHQHHDFRGCCPVCWTRYSLTRFPNKTAFSCVRTGLIQYKNYMYWTCPCHYTVFLKSPDRYLYAGGPKLKRVFERLYLDPSLAQGCESYRAGGHCVVCYCQGWPKQVLKKGYTGYILGHQNTVYAFCSEECMDEFQLRSEFYSSVEIRNEDNVVKEYTPLSHETLSLHPLGFFHQYVADVLYSALKELVSGLPYYPGLSAEQSALIYVGYHLKCKSLTDPSERECYEQGYSRYKRRMQTLKRLMKAVTHAKNPYHPDANLTDENQIAEFKKQIVESMMTTGRTESTHCKIHGQKLYTAQQMPAVVAKYSKITASNARQATRVVDKCLKSLFTYFNDRS